MSGSGKRALTAGPYGGASGPDGWPSGAGGGSCDDVTGAVCATGGAGTPTAGGGAGGEATGTGRCARPGAGSSDTLVQADSAASASPNGQVRTRAWRSFESIDRSSEKRPAARSRRI